MRNKSLLRLLVIDQDQRSAERLVALLAAYYNQVHLGFLDDKEELLKVLRQPWDVLIFGQGYDLSFAEVAAIVEERRLDLPIIGLMSNELAATGRNDDGLPAVIDGPLVSALWAEKETQVVMAICLQHANLGSRRQLAALQQSLADSERRANILIKNCKTAVAYLDQGIHVFANNAYLALFGFDNLTDIVGMPIVDLIAGADSVQSFKQFLRQFDKGSREQVEFSFESLRLDGTTFVVNLQLAITTLDAEAVTQIIIQPNIVNSTDSENSENSKSTAALTQQLDGAEYQDNLTGLSNRYGFEAYFATFYERALAEKTSASLLYIYLDNSDKICHSLGLQGLDATVKQVGYLLNSLITEGYVSRFSDAAFMILVAGLSKQALIELAEGIRLAISELLIEVDTHTTASIGVVKMAVNATSAVNTAEPKVFIERAIAAINSIKIATNNQGDAYHVYDANEHANSDAAALAELLANAISQNHFELLFQPIYDVEADCSDFFEVYLQLPLADADNSILSAEHFMSAAKTYQLADKIDRWLLINACKQLNQMRKSHPAAQLLVPLSSASLVDKNLSNIACQLIKAIGGTAGALTLQFREQDVAKHLTIAKVQFTKLSQIGCSVAMYDFSASAKSMEMADFIQPNMLRMTSDWTEDKDNSNPLQAMTALIRQAKALNIQVLIPHIEEAALMSQAWSTGARYLQGCYLEEPSNSMQLSTEK
jgi:diguanylate cyclase (GGDEF)-like protein/PAS domain S-box-containing protein